MKKDDVLISIRKIVRAINLENKRVQKQFGVSIPQLLCLTFLLNQHKTAANHKAIKEYLNLNASTVTGIISRLHEKQLVEKIPHSSDKRVVEVKLTLKAKKLLKNSPHLMHSQLDEKLKQLSSSDLNQLTDALQLLIDLMGIQNLDSSPVITASDPI